MLPGERCTDRDTHAHPDCPEEPAERKNTARTRKADDLARLARSPRATGDTARTDRAFRETVEEVCPPDIAALFVERSERIGNSFRMNIAMRRGDDITLMGPLKREAPPSWKPE